MDGRFHLEINTSNNQYQHVVELVLEDEYRLDWEEKNPDPHNKIVECRWDPEWPNNWRFCRFRPDKLDANHISVFEKIMISIQDNVTKEQV